MKPPTVPYSLASHNFPLSDPDILITPYSQTLSLYTHPLMWKNKFHNHVI